MSVEDQNPIAFERAARAAFEVFVPSAEWTSAGPTERGVARQAVRRILNELCKHGVETGMTTTVSDTDDRIASGSSATPSNLPVEKKPARRVRTPEQTD